MKNDPIQKDVFNIENKVIAIIGSVGILGKEYVKYLSSLGAIVIVGDINFSLCKKLSRKVNDLGYKALPLEIDNTDESSISDFFFRIQIFKNWVYKLFTF